MQDGKAIYDVYDLYLIDEWKSEGNVAPDLVSRLVVNTTSIKTHTPTTVISYGPKPSATTELEKVSE